MYNNFTFYDPLITIENYAYGGAGSGINERVDIVINPMLRELYSQAIRFGAPHGNIIFGTDTNPTQLVQNRWLNGDSRQLPCIQHNANKRATSITVYCDASDASKWNDWLYGGEDGSSATIISVSADTAITIDTER